MIAVTLEFYKRIGYWLIKKGAVLTEGSKETDEIIRLEKMYITTGDNLLKEKSNNLIKKLGGGILRI